MPVVRAAKKTTGLESMSKALSEVLDTITQIKQYRGQQAMNQAALQAMAGAGTREDKIAAGHQAVTDTREQSQTSQGLLQDIMSAFDPRVPSYVGNAPIEALLTGEAVRGMLRPTATVDPEAERRKNIEYWSGMYNDAAKTLMGFKALYEDDEKYADQIKQAETLMKHAQQQLRQLGIGVPQSAGNVNPGDVDAVSMADPKVTTGGNAPVLNDSTPVVKEEGPPVPADLGSRSVPPLAIPLNDLLFYRNEMDPASIEELKAILATGDDALIARAYERMKQVYGENTTKTK